LTASSDEARLDLRGVFLNKARRWHLPSLLNPYVGADLSVMEADTQRMRASPKGVKPYVMTNLRTLDGLQAVISFIETKGMLRR
jgi:hypothetical protein